MWNTVVVGSGNKGNSAHPVFKIKGDHSISENQVSFWISSVYLDEGMTIFKNTREGQTLSRMIEEEASIHLINDYLKRLFLRKVKIDVLMRIIDESNKRAYNAGQSDKIREILGTLKL